MKFRSFVFERDMAEEAHLRAQGWKLKDTDRAYMVRHNMLTFGARWKVCRSKLDVAVYFLRAFAYYIKANIQRLLESKNKIFFALLVAWVLVCSPIIPRGGAFYKGGTMAKVYAITPTRAEAAYIRYRLALGGHSLAELCRKVKCKRQLASGVLGGRDHAAKIEKAIARACGFGDWNTMLRYIRSASAQQGQMLPAA